MAEQEIIEIGDLDVEAFNEFATEQGWSDGMPLYVADEEKSGEVRRDGARRQPPFAPSAPRQIVPTLQSLAANAVMAGCKPEYFPVVTAAMRACSIRVQFARHSSRPRISCAPMSW